MAARIKIDHTGNVESPSLLLATRSGRIIGSIPATNIHLSAGLSPAFEISLTVNKFDNGIQCAYWDDIKDLRLLYCPEWNVFFEISVELSEESDTVKNITGYTLCDSELSQVNLYGVEINTEDDILRDDYVPAVLFDETNPGVSILGRIVSKVPHYRIVHVDASIAGIQRMFSFDGTSLHDAFQEIATEINCVFVYNNGLNDAGKIAREISVFDLESCCLDCHHRAEFIGNCPECGSSNISTGFGADTAIFVSSENLAENITLTSDIDSVKNCFRLEAGDDLMTATVANCNPNGSSYLWHISDEMRRDMSAELQDKLNEYDLAYHSYNREYEVAIDQTAADNYNSIIQDYDWFIEEINPIDTSAPIVGYSNLMALYYDTIDLQLILHDSLMPTVDISGETSAIAAGKLTSTSLSPVAVTNLDTCSESTATSSVVAMANAIVGARFRVRAKNTSYENHVWTGVLTVTNYSDEEDVTDTPTVSIQVNDDYETFTRQRLEKAMAESSTDVTDISGLFAIEDDLNFQSELNKYCVVSLQGFADACQGCIDIMIEQGIGDSSHECYESLYMPYYRRLGLIQTEISERESQIEAVVGKFDSDGLLIEHGIQSIVLEQIHHIQDELNFEDYLGTDLWHEFLAHRREDTYQNSNYISDGLSNSELISNALEFFEVASKEIVKASTLQHSLESTLKNLLIMKEFRPIVNYFEIGNWIRIAVDNTVYRLRLIAYEIDFSNTTTIPVQFSDVTKTFDGVSDAESIMQQAASMASSYSAVARQASQGSSSRATLDSWVSDGLALTQVQIVNNADNQNIVWTNNGLLCREYLPITDAYDDRQLKIINRGLYITNDNWATSHTGIGEFIYYDPETGEQRTGFGVIADTLVGNLILSRKVGVYNEDGSIVMDEDGVMITTSHHKEDKKIFTIRKASQSVEGVTTYSNLLYVENDGDLVFSGTLRGASGEFSGNISANQGTIGGAQGWIIGEGSIHSINSPTFASGGGIYLGSSEGISIGSAILMKPDGSFIIRGDNQSDNENNYIMKITPLVSRSDNSTRYQMHLGNVTLDGSFVVGIPNGGTGAVDSAGMARAIGIHRATSEDAMNAIANVNDGDLCILYSTDSSGATVSGSLSTSTTISPPYLPIASYSTSGHRNTSYFDIDNINYWNIKGLSGDGVSAEYARVGVGTSVSLAAALYAPLTVDIANSSSGAPSITVNFIVNTRPSGATRDLSDTWSNGIAVSLYNLQGVRVAHSIYTLPSAWQEAKDEDKNASIELTSNVSGGITDGTYYVVFHSRSVRSLMWIKMGSITIPERAVGAASGLFLRTAGQWLNLTNV